MCLSLIHFHLSYVRGLLCKCHVFVIWYSHFHMLYVHRSIAQMSCACHVILTLFICYTSVGLLCKCHVPVMWYSHFHLLQYICTYVGLSSVCHVILTLSGCVSWRLPLVTQQVHVAPHLSTLNPASVARKAWFNNSQTTTTTTTYSVCKHVFLNASP